VARSYPQRLLGLYVTLCVLYSVLGCQSPQDDGSRRPTALRLLQADAGGTRQAMGKRRFGTITSEPPGARVKLRIGQGSYQEAGTTPCTIDAPLSSGGTIELSLGGYEKEVWLVPASGPIDQHCILDRNYEVTITQEKPQYSVEYIKAAVAVLSKCEKAQKSPSSLMPAATAEAKADFDQLKLSFPQHRGSGIEKALTRIVRYLEDLENVGGTFRTWAANDFFGPDIERYARQIRRPLGLE
jgi:hypothetical protein